MHILHVYVYMYTCLYVYSICVYICMLLVPCLYQGVFVYCGQGSFCVLLSSTVCAVTCCARGFGITFGILAVVKTYLVYRAGVWIYILKLILWLTAIILRRWCNNVVSRVFTDGRQGGCQRLDRVMDMLQALYWWCNTHTYTHFHLSTCTQHIDSYSADT